jgi:tetratricopeptide (TPR) repeat protein
MQIKPTKRLLKLLTIFLLIFLYLPQQGIAQPSPGAEYIGGFRIISQDDQKKKIEDDLVNSTNYKKDDSLLMERDYEKVFSITSYYINENNTAYVKPYYYHNISSLYLRRYTDALTIAEKGIAIKEKLGWKKKVSEYTGNDDDKEIAEAILYAGKYKALMGLKKYDEALIYCSKANKSIYYYNTISDITDFYIPICFDLARLRLYVGDYKAAIAGLNEVADRLNDKSFREYWKKTTLDMMEYQIYTAICHLNYLNNTPDNIPEKVRKGAWQVFSEYGHLITLYNEGKYQQYITEFTKIDDGKFGILYKYLGLAYHKLNQKQESCEALKKYRSKQYNRIPKVEPEVDEVEAIVCK